MKINFKNILKKNTDKQELLSELLVSENISKLNIALNRNELKTIYNLVDKEIIKGEKLLNKIVDKDKLRLIKEGISFYVIIKNNLIDQVKSKELNLKNILKKNNNKEELLSELLLAENIVEVKISLNREEFKTIYNVLDKEIKKNEQLLKNSSDKNKTIVIKKGLMFYQKIKEKLIDQINL